MAQNSTKGLNPKSASGGRKKTGLTKKGKRDCAPKQIDRARQAASMKKLSSSINNSIERQMVQAASTGKLGIMKNCGAPTPADTKGKGKGKGKGKAEK